MGDNNTKNKLFPIIAHDLTGSPIGALEGLIEILNKWR